MARKSKKSAGRRQKKSLTDNQVKEVRKEVSRAIHRNLENKVADYSQQAVNLSNPSNGTYFPACTQQITPFASGISIQQGTGQGSRIGNEINVVKAVLNFAIYLQDYDATFNPTPVPQYMEVCIWKGKGIANTDLAGARTLTTTNFFQAGSSSTGYTGYLLDRLQDINKDKVTLVSRRKYKVGASNYTGNTGAQANFYNYANNDFKAAIVKRMDITKHYPKRIQYNDTTNTPTNITPMFVTFATANFDGTVDTYVPLYFDMQVQVEYEDA